MGLSGFGVGVEIFILQLLLRGNLRRRKAGLSDDKRPLVQSFALVDLLRVESLRFCLEKLRALGLLGLVAEAD